MLVFASASSCGSRSLVEVDVVGDTPFQGVTLKLVAANSTTKLFPNVSFAAGMPYKAGLYLPDGVTGNVTIVGTALDGANQCIGVGQVSITGVAAGATAGPATLTVSHSANCSSGASNVDAGAGGSTGDGSGGAGGANAGVGGTTGAGGATGGAAGTTGTGGGTGQPPGNLISNGDFSNGETSWGIPAMVGSVTHAVTGGAFCVTLGAANSSATIGYPAGSTPPFQITSGASYLLSYQASLSGGGTTLEAKVGQTMTPYDATGSDWPNEPVGTSLQTLSHTFTRGTTDSMMGIAFNVVGGPGTVCVDNVSLTTN